jgi:acyl phosphate:glycerol-3-phosphate acyltransferase
MGAAGRLDLEPAAAMPWLAVATAAMLGHIFPIWLRFRGGKGVATGLGAVLGFWPILTLPALAAAGTWIILAAVTRYVSLASVVAALAMPIYLIIAALCSDQAILGWWPMLLVTSGMAVLIAVKHRANLRRIRQGSEPKIGSARAAGVPKPRA